MAISHDPDFPNRKLSAQMIEFKIDCDNATKAALDGNPSLLADWRKLIDGESVPNEKDIIARCAKVYRARHLTPHEYFVVIKRGRTRHSATVQAGAA